MREVVEGNPPAVPASIRGECGRCRVVALAAAEVANAPDERRALKALLERAVEATGAERAFLVTARRESGRVEPVVLARVSRRADGREDPSRTVFHRALASPRAFVCPEGAADPRLADAASVRALRLRTVVAVPLRREDGSAAALVLDSALAAMPGDAIEELLAGFAALATLAAHRRRGGDPGSPSPDTDAGAGPLLGRSSSFRTAVAEARRVAATSLPVLVQGESGTGKESLARLVHDASPRRAGPFVALNCAAIPESLIEAEMFGAVRGAYTGAERDRAGLLRAAHGGTLFLDEVGDMPLAMQAKLLRVLQDGRVRAVGAERETEADVRIVAATHRDLAASLAGGRFREDLYWRLAVVTVRLPPLRERPEDIEELAQHVIERLGRRHGLASARLTAGALERLRSHPWPGNVRELEAVLARAVLAQGGGDLPAEALAFSVVSTPLPAARTARLEEAMILDALAASGAATEAARRIGWSRQKLYRRMGALGIPPRGAPGVRPRGEAPAAPSERDLR